MTRATVSEERVYPYEGLFLFPQAQTASLQEAVDHVEAILKRADAEVIALQKWDERRLAYEIKGNKRGVYFLAYFRARTGALRGIERDCNLSEKLLRSMIIRADHIPLEVMEAADGRARLADEIALRGREAEGSRGGGEEAAEEDEPVEVEVESVSTDAASRVEG